jgi:hypothetical protein
MGKDKQDKKDTARDTQTRNSKGQEQEQGGVTDKLDKNAGSGAFNQGSEQDPDYNDGTKVSDDEKKTGHLPSHEQGKSADQPDTGKR